MSSMCSSLVSSVPGRTRSLWRRSSRALRRAPRCRQAAPDAAWFEHSGASRAPDLVPGSCKGTDKGTDGVRTGWNHNILWSLSSSPTGCCGVLVPHTGFHVNRLMLISRRRLTCSARTDESSCTSCRQGLPGSPLPTPEVTTHAPMVLASAGYWRRHLVSHRAVVRGQWACERVNGREIDAEAGGHLFAGLLRTD